MRLANLAAFKRYTANMIVHRIPRDEQINRLNRALDHSGIFLSTHEFGKCVEFVNSYGETE